MQKIIPPNVKEVNTDQPVRIQRKRTKGWKMSEQSERQVVYVDRPTRWGNPFDWRVLIGPGGVTDNEAKRYTAQHFDHWLKNGEWKSLELVQNMSISLIELGYKRQWMLDNIHTLRDKNLACWCRLDQPCHADVLLKLANQTNEK